MKEIITWIKVRIKDFVESKIGKTIIPLDKEIAPVINHLKKNNMLAMQRYTAQVLYYSVKNVSKIDGDIAEVGVFKGGSAKIICEAKKEKTLYLFDTFSGLPEVSEIDDERFFKGRFKESLSSLDIVKEFLSEYKNVFFYKGIFPETSKPIADKRFSFVNLDVDLYKSTLDSLEFFYPRMNKGGIIMCHDYPGATGVKRAVNEFFKDKPEIIINITANQALIIKL